MAEISLTLASKDGGLTSSTYNRDKGRAPGQPVVKEDLRTYPDLSACCLKERLDLSLRLWYLLRQGHLGGHGWLALADVYALSCGNRRQTKRWLRQGAGTFWHKDAQGRLWLHSLAKVSLALDVKPKKAPVPIPIGDIESLAKFRAVLFASWLAGAPRTMSQALLGEIFGRQERTIWRWCKLAGVNVQENMVWSRLPGENSLKVYPVGVMATLGVKTPEEEAATPGKIKHWLECWTEYPYKESWQYKKGKKPALVRQFVNTYSVEMKRGPKTRLQRQAARGVKVAKTPSHGLEDLPARPPVKGRIVHPRFPFIEDKQVFKARLQKRRKNITKSLQQNGFAYVQGQARHHGAVLWEFQTLA